MDRQVQDENDGVSGFKHLKKACKNHENEQVSIINLLDVAEANSRLQCVECQYEQISNNVKVNFLPLKKLLTTQIDESSVAKLFNWPIVNEEAQKKLHLYDQLLSKAQLKLGEVSEKVDSMIKEITQVLQEYQKNSISFYHGVIEEAQNVIYELSDINSLQKLKDILMDGQDKELEDLNNQIHEMIEDKYLNMQSSSSQIIDSYNQYSQKLSKFDDFSNNLTLRHNKLLQFVQSFTKAKNRILKPEIEIVKSLGRDSNKLSIQSLEHEINIQKLTDYYGWCYSSSILDNQSTYEMEFSFQHEPQNYIMVGLIPDEQKDTEPPGQGKSHFCKIFGDSNNFYCGLVKSGDLIEKQVKSGDSIKMKVCIDEGVLEFSDKYGNINIMHTQYTLSEFQQYRICFQFGQRSKNTIKIHKFELVSDLSTIITNTTVITNQKSQD